MAAKEIVVVGGGLAAGRLASEYRAAGGEQDVTIVGAEPDPPYNRPPLTKGYLRGELEREGTFVRPPEEWEEAVVELRLDTRVEAIHPDEHEVELAGGERLGLRDARPRDRRAAAHAAAARRATSSASTPTGRSPTPRRCAPPSRSAHSAIVIGGSFIGAEAAASLRRRGLDVTLVELGPMLMPQLACPDLSRSWPSSIAARGSSSCSRRSSRSSPATASS